MQRILTKILENMLGNGVQVYFDNIVIYAKIDGNMT